MTAPIFGNFIKIKHEKTINRKEFITDVVIIAMASAIFQTALDEKLQDDPELVQLHRNKDRKTIKKHKEYNQVFQNGLQSIYRQVCNKDNYCIADKRHQNFISFVRIASSYKDVNLELLAICLLDLGLRRKRRTKLHSSLNVFSDYKFLFGKIGAEMEATGIHECIVETKIAEELVLNIKY